MHDCPRIYSPFQPHHHQQQHLYEWKVARKMPKVRQNWVEPGENVGGADGGWGDLHLIACIS